MDKSHPDEIAHDAFHRAGEASKVAVAYFTDPSFAIALLRRAGAATKAGLASAKHKANLTFAIR